MELGIRVTLDEDIHYVSMLLGLKDIRVVFKTLFRCFVQRFSYLLRAFLRLLSFQR